MPKPCGKMLYVVMNGCKKKRNILFLSEPDCLYLEGNLFMKEISEKEMFITNELFFSSV